MKLVIRLGCVFLFLGYTIVETMENSRILVNDATTKQAIQKKVMNDCWIAVSKGNYDGAYYCFVDAVKNGTFGGFVFEAITNGLVIFEHLKPLSSDCSGISEESIRELLAVSKEHFYHVFLAVNYIVNNQKSMPSPMINECLEYVKTNKLI
jgi:hypothetical protein